jgi:hypothetical protein
MGRPCRFRRAASRHFRKRGDPLAVAFTLASRCSRRSNDRNLWMRIATGVKVGARLLYGQREDLEKIDRDAHQKIDGIRAAARGLANRTLASTAVWEVVMQAIAEAKKVDAEAAGRITASTEPNRRDWRSRRAPWRWRDTCNASLTPSFTHSKWFVQSVGTRRQQT